MELNFENDEIEVDLAEVVRLLFKKAWIIVASALVCALAVVVYGKFIVTPVYESTSSILVINQRDESGADGYFAQSTELTDDYVEVITSRRVVNQMIKNLGLSATYEDVIGSITTNIPEETRIIEITVADRDAAMAKKMTDELQKLAIIQIEELLEVYSAKSLDEGNYPQAASGFATKKYAVIAFLGGACLAVAAIVILFLLDSTIKTADHVKQYLKCATLGAVSVKSKDNEAYEVLKTNIKASKDDIRTLAVTSSRENEGAADISYELAGSFAENDKKVLYIDADLRTGEKCEKSGLADILNVEKKLSDICEPSGISNLTIVAAGKCEKPGVLLDSRSFYELLTQAKEAYDIIIINTPSVEKYIDAAIVAKQCDGVVIVVEAGMTKYTLVQKTMQQLAYVDSDILGCIIHKK